MTKDLAVIDPAQGDELFAAQRGERRIPWSALVEMPHESVVLFQKAISDYVAAHPRLDVVVVDSKGTDEMIVRWRWRSA